MESWRRSPTALGTLQSGWVHQPLTTSQRPLATWARTRLNSRGIRLLDHGEGPRLALGVEEVGMGIEAVAGAARGVDRLVQTGGPRPHPDRIEMGVEDGVDGGHGGQHRNGAIARVQDPALACRESLRQESGGIPARLRYRQPSDEFSNSTGAPAKAAFSGRCSWIQSLGTDSLFPCPALAASLRRQPRGFLPDGVRFGDPACGENRLLHPRANVVIDPCRRSPQPDVTSSCRRTLSGIPMSLSRLAIALDRPRLPVSMIGTSTLRRALPADIPRPQRGDCS